MTALLLSCSSANTLRQSRLPDVDYSQYRSYVIVAPVPSDSDNPAFRWPQLNKRIRNDLNFLLPSVGLDPATDRADLYIFPHIIADSDGRDPMIPYQIGWRAEPFLESGERIDEYPDNTLVLDFVDPNLNELIWRGSTRLPLSREKETYKVLTERLKKLVRQYPHPPSQP